MISFDTNVLFYSIDPVAGERHKAAKAIIRQTDPMRSVVLLQTLGELCFSVGRKRPDLLETAHRITRELADTFQIANANKSDLSEAITARQQHGLQFWDAMLWATARRAGCTLLLSEDMQDGRSLGGVVFRNPFKMTTQELETILA